MRFDNENNQVEADMNEAAERQWDPSLTMADIPLDEDGKIDRMPDEDYSEYARRCAKVERDFPYSSMNVVARGELRDGVRWYAVNPQLSHHSGGLNGYIRLPERMLPFHGYRGEVGMIGVHGGVTFYTAATGGGCAYGFDTNHYGSEEYPTWDADWIRAECEAMLEGIEAIADGAAAPDRETLMGLGHFVAAMGAAGSDPTPEHFPVAADTAIDVGDA